MSEKPDLPIRNVRPKDPPCAEDAALRAGATPLPTEPEDLSALPRDLLPTPFTPAPVDNDLGRLGPYRLLSLLGRGGMGLVYRAHDPQLGRDVAVKCLRPTLAANHEAHDRFLREARAVASLSHDNIVAVHQVGEADGVPYMVMELLSGMSLADWLERGGQPSVAQILRIGRDVARGLAAAHARGLVHRDIKPGNLWLESVPVTRPGRTPISAPFRVKILDFGLARAVDADGLTRHGMVIGTPRFLAPEQATGGLIDARADLFSLGCVLYRLATGQLPFGGDGLDDALLNLATTTPPPVRDLNPAIPPALADLIMRLLASDPAQRPASACEVEESLRTIPRRSAEGSRPGQKGPAGGAARPTGPPRRKTWLVAAGVLAATVLGLGASVLFLALFGSPESDNNNTPSW